MRKRKRIRIATILLVNLVLIVIGIEAVCVIFFFIQNGTFFYLRTLGLAPRVEGMANLRLIDPVGYLDFLKLMSHARIILTDSGGMQEETTILKVPCLTLRENTERPVTTEVGSNLVVGTDTGKILAAYHKVMNGQWRKPGIPPLWDGQAAQRIVDVLANPF